MTLTITAFAASPDRGRGLARDMRVRWALEELGQPYEVRLETFAELKQPEHLARNPFGQIPTLEDGDLTLFESGAILLRLVERFGGLLPDDPEGRARAIMWMFAAVATVEPPIVDLSFSSLFEADRPWHADRLPVLQERVRARLGQLSAFLGDREWLDGDFSVGDLMMIHVLLRARSSTLVDEVPNVAAYVARGEARPAYQRAFAAQKAVFEASQAAR